MKTLVAPLAILATLLLSAAPAGAHGGEGTVEITGQRRSGDDVTVVARVTYVADGHVVEDATVTVVVDDGTPVPMGASAQVGLYEATVPAPPGATIRVTSVDPPASAEATALEASTSTTEASSTTAAAESTTTEATVGADDTDSGSSVPEPNGIDEAPDGDGGGGNAVVLAVLVIVVVGAVGAAFLLRRKKPGEV